MRMNEHCFAKVFFVFLISVFNNAVYAVTISSATFYWISLWTIQVVWLSSTIGFTTTVPPNVYSRPRNIQWPPSVNKSRWKLGRSNGACTAGGWGWGIGNGNGIVRRAATVKGHARRVQRSRLGSNLDRVSDKLIWMTLHLLSYIRSCQLCMSTSVPASGRAP